MTGPTFISRVGAVGTGFLISARGGAVGGAIRRQAELLGFPANRITEIFTVIDPSTSRHATTVTKAA